MSAIAQKWAEAQKIADPTLMAVLRAVAWFANRGTGVCTKSQGEIATRSSMDARSVRRALSVLERLEIVRRRRRSRGQYGRTSDEITLSVERNFDVSRSAIRALRATTQPDRLSSCKTNPQPDRESAATGQRVRAYNQVNQDTLTSRIEPNSTSYYAQTRAGAAGWDDDAPFGKVVAFRGGRS